MRLYCMRYYLGLQEDFSEEEGIGGAGSPPVTSQPSPQKQPPPQQVFAMPPPPNESAALNQGERTVYTPGI